MLLFASLSAAAQNASYEDVAGVLSWANGNETNATASAEITDAVLETSVKVGSDLSVTGPTSYSSIPEFTVPLMTYQPSTGNPGCVSGDMVEYKIKLKKGLTFKPTSVSFDAVKEGTDNAYFSWSYTVDGTEGDIVAYSTPKEQIRRNNNANPTAPYTHEETINANGGREFTLRFYMSNVDSSKKMSIGNIKINGVVNGTAEGRAFKNFAIDMTANPYRVTVPADGVLPDGVKVEGNYHNEHGYYKPVFTVPVDGPVKFSIGNCQYSGTDIVIKSGDEVLATLPGAGACGSLTTWTYNSETPATLTINGPQYCPSFAAEACELIPIVEVSYYDTDGSLLGKEDIQGGSALEYKYGEADVKVAQGEKFRGWFASTQSTALKVPAGTSVQENLKLYARATKIEEPTSTSRFTYDLTKPYFYVEDHEVITIDGKYYNNHGWIVNKGGAIKVNVSGKCYVTVNNCQYSAASNATVTDESGTKIAEFPVKSGACGEAFTFVYDGQPGWLTITFPEGSYTHGVSVWNVVEFLDYDEATGYYKVNASDVSSFLLALRAAASKEGAKIFLPDGVYDLGTDVLTGVSGKKVSIIGQSMKNTIIKNAPPKDQEGIDKTATLINTASELYLQDLTLRNAMAFDGSTGRAVALHDKGNKTICKNVSLESYQDTYYSNNNSACNYFEDGEIHGVVDYVCGGGDVYFNHVKFVNEAIKDATPAAPYGAKKYGYVMNNCIIETLCSKFNLGRSWGPYSGLAWINTTINQPEKLIATRFNVTGMNSAADKFVEYNSVDVNGKVLTPASNILEFTHSSGNKKYETVLTAEQAAEYAIEKVFPDWRPEEIAVQVQYVEGEDLTGNVYLVDGKLYAGTLPAGKIKVRKANSRGGFGPEVETTFDPAAIKNVVPAEKKSVKAVYNVGGQMVSQGYNGTKIIVYSDGTTLKVK